MKSWMKERDLLVQETLAFVQGVTASKPIRIAPTEPAVVPAALISQTVVSQTVISQTVVSPIVVSSTAVSASSVATAVHDEILRHPASPPIFSRQILSQQQLPAPASERANILKRVAAFRALQGRALQERETYYETVQAKIRTVLGNEMAGGRLGRQSSDKTL